MGFEVQTHEEVMGDSYIGGFWHRPLNPKPKYRQEPYQHVSLRHYPHLRQLPHRLKHPAKKKPSKGITHDNYPRAPGIQILPTLGHLEPQGYGLRHEVSFRRSGFGDCLESVRHGSGLSVPVCPSMGLGFSV